MKRRSSLQSQKYGKSRQLIRYSCKISREVHDKRHRKIAALIQEIERIDGVLEGPTSLISSGQRKASSYSSFKECEKSPGLTDNATFEIDWEDSSTLFDEEDDFKALYGKENALSKKAKRAERKVARNQARFTIITPEDMARVDAALHPDSLDSNGLTREQRSSNDPLDNHTIEANIAFNPGTFKFEKLRQAVHIKRMLKNNGPPKNSDGPADENLQLDTIVHRLGIRAVVANNSKERKSLMTKLHEAIKADLVCIANEDRDTMERMAGYWRYANRRTYNVMVRNNQLWDWSTGAKLEEIEEDEDDEDDISSLDERFSEMSTAATTPSIPYSSPYIDEWKDAFDLASERALAAENSDTSQQANERDSSASSAFDGKADTRHIQPPTRVVAADKVEQPAVAPSLNVTPPRRSARAHHDVNNRFSPLAAISEEEPAAPRRPVAAITVIARNRSPIRNVRFPATRGSAVPAPRHCQRKDGKGGGGPRAGLPTRGRGKPTRGSVKTYASILRQGL